MFWLEARRFLQMTNEGDGWRAGKTVLLTKNEFSQPVWIRERLNQYRFSLITIGNSPVFLTKMQKNLVRGILAKTRKLNRDMSISTDKITLQTRIFKDHEILLIVYLPGEKKMASWLISWNFLHSRGMFMERQRKKERARVINRKNN